MGEELLLFEPYCSTRLTSLSGYLPSPLSSSIRLKQLVGHKKQEKGGRAEEEALFDIASYSRLAIPFLKNPCSKKHRHIKLIPDVLKAPAPYKTAPPQV